MLAATVVGVLFIPVFFVGAERPHDRSVPITFFS